MSTACGIPSTRLDCFSSLDAATLINAAPAILKDVCRHAAVGALPVTHPLESLFIGLFGLGHPRSRQLRFLFFAAPIVRKITVASLPDESHLGASSISVADVKSWLNWLDATDPLCSRMIDLYYFAGLSIRETAAALSVPRRVVIRELRFARSWLCIKLTPDDA